MVFSNYMIKNDLLDELGARGSIAEVLTVLLTPISTYVIYVICLLSFVSYDINDRLCHMTRMTDDIWHKWHMSIWVSKEPPGPQQLSLWLQIWPNYYFWSYNLKIPPSDFSLYKFWKSFVYLAISKIKRGNLNIDLCSKCLTILDSE